MKKLKIFESFDENSEQVQHLISAIQNYYNDFGDTLSEQDYGNYSGVPEVGKKAWALEKKFFEYYKGTNFDQIIQSVIKENKEFVYKSFLELLGGKV